MWTLHKIKSDGIFPSFKWNQVFVKVLKNFLSVLCSWLLKIVLLNLFKATVSPSRGKVRIWIIFYILRTRIVLFIFIVLMSILIFLLCISCTLRDWHITGRSACFPVTEPIYYYSLKRYNQNIAVKKAIKIWRFWRNSNLTEKYFH